MCTANNGDSNAAVKGPAHKGEFLQVPREDQWQDGQKEHGILNRNSWERLALPSLEKMMFQYFGYRDAKERKGHHKNFTLKKSKATKNKTKKT